MTTAYHSDELSAGHTAARTVAAGLAGGVLTLAGWFVLHHISLAAFNTSYVTRALAVGAAFAALILAGLAGWMWWRGHRNLLWEAVLSLAPAVLVLSLIGVPLAATRLYLDGIQVDQGFRTQFLSRMAESVTHGDMNYVDLPSFYPLGWFWLGGRMANLLGMPGWEVYQPWALVSLAAAASMLTPIWHRLTGSLPAAAGIALITTSVVLAEVAVEPYAAVVGMFLPAAAVGARRALAGSWPATVAVMVYLGLSATFYTLYTAVGALTVVVLALIVCLTERRWWGPIKHLLVIGFGSIAIALISWGPYLRKLLSGEFDAHSTANHFLPEEGTYIPLPFFEFSVVGLLSLIGLIYLLVRARSTTRPATHSTAAQGPALSLGVAALVCYFWVVLSMAFALLGTSLLGFRIEVLLMLIFVTAGVLGITAAIEKGGQRLYPDRWSARAKSTATVVAGVLVGAGTLAYAQQIPEENQEYIDQAYADTDGYGERADRFPADAARYYADVVAFLEEHGRRPNEAVIYTDEINFMAFNPYFGFNAFTSHYANPLGEFDRRNEELVSWAELSHSDPAALTKAIDASPWRAPEAFIFRGDIESGSELKTHVAHDIFPSQPNVRYEGLFFNSEAFDEADWDMEQIGPFVVVVRK